MTVIDTRNKLVEAGNVAVWRAGIRARGQTLVVTNGCFDILHAGHVAYLEQARSLGDALLIGLNGDSSVRELKGPGRPLNPEMDRARVLAGLACVDGVLIFPEKRAARFLAEAQPDIYVKGGDYTLETLDADERRAVEASGGRIAFIAFLEGRSTTKILEKARGE
jgi:rfaE bifunctional protein nucleotidyltransferase chain/domain